MEFISSCILFWIVLTIYRNKKKEKQYRVDEKFLSEMDPILKELKEQGYEIHGYDARSGMLHMIKITKK